MAWTMILRWINSTWCVIFILHLVDANEIRVPVGLIFDSDSKDLARCVSETIARYNREDRTRINMSFHTNWVNIQDSFNFTNAACKLLQKGAAVLIGVSSRSVESTVQAYTSNLHAPFIILNNPADYRGKPSSKYQLYMQPSQIRTLVDVIQKYEWQDIVYIYDSTDGLARVEQLHEIGQETGQIVDIDVRYVRSPDECYNLLAGMHYNSTGTAIRVVLDVPIQNANKVVKRVMQTPQILKMMFHFVIPHLDLQELEQDLKILKIGGVNITGFQLARDIPFQSLRARETFAIDAVTLLSKALEKLLERKGESGLIQSFDTWRMTKGKVVDCITRPPWVYGSTLTEILNNESFLGRSGNVSFNSNGQRKGFQLNVMEVSMYRGKAHAGTWNETGFHAQAPKLITDKFNVSIDNRTRIVVSIKDKPYLMIATTVKNGIPHIMIDRYYGFCVDLAEMVARNLNYEYFLRLVKDGNYGAKNRSGVWDGIIGELIRHEADIAIAPLTITSEREKVLDFTKPYMSLGISIMIKKPKNEPPHVFSFMEPLSEEIWLCTAFAFIGVSVVLFLVSRFSTEEWQVDGEDQKLTNDFTIGNSLWFSLGAFMQQGCDVLPKSISGRMVTSVWWFFTLIVISSYTANLAAYLTAMRMSTPISSAEDLAKQTEIKYGTGKAGSTWAFFNGSTVSLYQRMMSFMTSQPSVFVNSNAEGIARVRKEDGKYAFLIESTTNDYHNQLLPCDTMKVGNDLDSKGYGIATPMGSDIRDKLTLAILELREQAELTRLKKFWWYAKSQCPADKDATVSKDSKDNALTLKKVAGIFYILIVGLALSVLSAICEFLYKTKVDSKKQNVSFGSEARSKFRLSISGHSDDDSQGVRTPLRASGATFTYTGPDNVRKTHTIV